MSGYTDLFPNDYLDSRQRFRTLVDKVGWRLEAHPMPEDASLAIDFAVNECNNRPALLITSGLHGVEGFFGSAVQQALLQDLAKPQDRCRIILVHALNPFGFCHCRRANENNIDLNRNFVLDGDSFEGSHPVYRELDSFLNPKLQSTFDFYHLRAAMALLKHGNRKITGALVEGQYDFPNGIYFGGTSPSWTHQVLDETIDRLVGNSNVIIHLDLHTGLGKFGSYMMMMEPGCTLESYEFASSALREHNVLLPQGTAKAYQARGNIGSWLQRRFADRRFLYFCAEFGTYPGVTVLKGLRDENRSFQIDGLGSVEHTTARQRLKDLFVPPSRAWREQTVAASMNLVRKACEVLAKHQ